MLKNKFRKIAAVVYIIGIILLLIDISPAVEIFNIYDRFHPISVMLVWSAIMYIFIQPTQN